MHSICYPILFSINWYLCSWRIWTKKKIWTWVLNFSKLEIKQNNIYTFIYVTKVLVLLLNIYEIRALPRNCTCLSIEIGVLTNIQIHFCLYQSSTNLDHQRWRHGTNTYAERKHPINILFIFHNSLQWIYSLPLSAQLSCFFAYPLIRLSLFFVKWQRKCGCVWIFRNRGRILIRYSIYRYIWLWPVLFKCCT